jgi:fatty-acyl-CoA synthase/long-chain acyl-CoA synthetase
MDILAMHAEGRPDAPAVIEDVAGEEPRILSYKQLNEQANRVANGLMKLGVKLGDKVITTGYNAPEHFICTNAVSKMAGTNVPMNYRLKPKEMAYQIDNSDCVAIFVGPHQIDVVEAARKDAPNLRFPIAWGTDSVPDGWLTLAEVMDQGEPTQPEIPEGAAGGLMLYTSGTTGNPKGAHRRARAGGATTAATGGNAFNVQPGTPHLAAGPLYHSAPFSFAGAGVLLGGGVVVMRRFEPEESLRLIEKYKAAWTFMAPTLLMRIVNLPDEVKKRYDVSSMTSIVVAAAPCPFDVKRRVLDLFGPSLYEFYGASETGMNTLMTPEEHLKKPGACGKVVEGQDVKVLDEEGNECPTGTPGEIFIKAPGMIDEYYKNESATKESWRGEYFTVGDVGYFDEDGYLYISDRKKDMIISGGVNIYCAEIENAIHAHPKVWDVAVIGIPHEEFGEQVHAIVQPKPNESLTGAEIITWVGENLADYKKPRSVEFRDDFPRDEAGKIRKRDLREPFWEGHATRV